MKSLKIGISALLVLNTISVQAQSLSPSTEKSLDQIANDINQSESIIWSEELKLRGELLLKESILEGFESMDSFNEAAGLNSEYGKFVAIPAAVASIYFLAVGTPKAISLVNLLTPAEKLKVFTSELNAIEREVRIAKGVLSSAEASAKKLQDDVASGRISADANALVSAEEKIKASKLRYEAAIGRKTLHLQVKPGVFYKTGRFIRGAAKTTLVVGGVVLSVSMISDVVILWLPENVEAYKNQTTADVLALRSLLGQDF